SIGLADHVPSLIVPGWSLPIAAAFVKVTVPKFVSGTGRHFPNEQLDGASAIHSAEATSRLCAVVSTFEKRVRRVTSRRLNVIVWAFTSTAAVIVSPGKTARGM